MTRKESLIVAIATLITVTTWVIFNIIHIRSQTEIPANLQEIAEPINPTIDIEAIENEQ